MGVYSTTEYTRKVKCEKCGKEYIETLCEYIGGPKYWSGNCECTPICRDSVIELLEYQIKKLNCDIITSDWNYEVINLINNKLKKLIDESFIVFPKYSACKEFLKDGNSNKYFYITMYPSKKDIANYVGKNINIFYKENKNINKEKVFINEILNITKEDFSHYLSYVCKIRKENR